MPENRLREITPADILIAATAAKEVANLAIIAANCLNDGCTEEAVRAAVLFREGRALPKELHDELTPDGRRQLRIEIAKVNAPS